MKNNNNVYAKHCDVQLLLNDTFGSKLGVVEFHAHL